MEGGGRVHTKIKTHHVEGNNSGSYTHLGRPLTRVALIQVFSERDVLVVDLPQQAGQLLFVPPVPATAPGESGVVTAIQSVQPQYRWRELPQVSFFVSTKVLPRQNASFVATEICWSRQNFCRDKIMFVATNTSKICRDKHVFVATKASMSQQNVCRDKHFVATKLLSRQAYICRDKTRIWSRQK